MSLTDVHRAVLAIERRSFRFQGSKEQAIHDELGMSAPRYYQLLGTVIAKPEALQHDPVLVNRLRRLRDMRRRARAS